MYFNILGKYVEMQYDAHFVSLYSYSSITLHFIKYLEFIANDAINNLILSSEISKTERSSLAYNLS